MDGITAHIMTGELDRLLAGSLVDRISMEAPWQVGLSLFTPSREKIQISLSANPSRPGLILGGRSEGQASNPPPSFIMFLRKHLRRARIKGVQSPPWERIFIFHLLAMDELGDEKDLKLIFECMPRTANLILVNQDDIIMGAIRHIDHRVNRVREILPAHPYLPPPPQNRLDPDLCPKLSPEQIFLSLDLKLKADQAISRAISGFSPFLGREAVYRAGLAPDLPLAKLDDPDRERLAETLKDLCRQILSGPFQPALYYDGPPDRPQSRPLVAHALPLTHLPYACPYDLASRAVSDYNRKRSQIFFFEERKNRLQRQVADLIRRAQKKRKAHEDDLAEGREAGHDRLLGELILASLHIIPPGSRGLDLDNYYRQGEKVFCPLDPGRSAADNANRYFSKAKRKERKLLSAEKLLADDLNELAWLTSLNSALEYAESHEDLTALEEDYALGKREKKKEEAKGQEKAGAPGLPASKRRKRQEASRARGKKAKAGSAREDDRALSPRRYLSSDGFLILSGRSQIQNDRLLRRAGKDDLWFHAKGQAGSHVYLIRSGLQDPPARSLEEAAGVAAWFSSAARAGGPVEVDYTRASELKRIPGTRPGHVSYQNYKTLYVSPLDPSLLEEG